MPVTGKWHFKVTNIANTLIELRRGGRIVIGLDRQGTQNLSDCVANHAGPGLVLVLGAEHQGLRPRVADQCDYLVKIPMAAGADSLNVSAAGAISLYECSRYDTRIFPEHFNINL